MKKTLLLGIVLALSQSAFGAEESAKPKYGPGTVPLSVDSSYVKKNPAPDFWAMMPFYLPQQTGSACSIASVTMVVNGARGSAKLKASDELATQNGVLKKVDESSWTDAVAEKGGGVNLDRLGKLVEKTFKTYGFNEVSVEVAHLRKNADGAAKLHSVLVENEKSSHDFVIANFLQSSLTGDPEGAIGHIAPIGAYDAKHRRVLILDPDRQWYEPYWVSEDALLAGMGELDTGAGQFRGLVWVKVGAKKGP